MVTSNDSLIKPPSFKNGLFVLTHQINDVVEIKPRNLWTREDK